MANKPEMMRSNAMAVDPIGCETARISSRTELVSSLLRESESATGKNQVATVKFPLAVRVGAPAEKAGMAWCLNGGDGPQTRRLDPARAVARWYLRGRTGLEELLLQLYFGHLSLAEVELVASIMWGEVEGARLVGEVAPDIVERIDNWLGRPLRDSYPYVFLHAVDLRGRRINEPRGTRLAAAVGIDQLGFREALGIVAAPIGSTGLWGSLLGNLAARGVHVPRIIVGDATDSALSAAVEKCWKGCAFLTPRAELERGFLDKVRAGDLHWVDRGVAELKGCASREEGERLGATLCGKLKRAGYAMLSVELGQRLRRHLACLDIPQAHWPRLGSANLVRTELNQVREQVRVLGPINDEKTLVLLAAATFRRQGRSSWDAKPFLSF